MEHRPFNLIEKCDVRTGTRNGDGVLRDVADDADLGAVDLHDGRFVVELVHFSSILTTKRRFPIANMLENLLR